MIKQDVDYTLGTGLCRLCGEKPADPDSHIIPAFVYKWQKESSVTGFIRFAGNINMRSQDGPTVKLLCHDCEKRFSAWETVFSRKIFHPYHSLQATRFEYGPWLKKFCVSLSWRVAVYLSASGTSRLNAELSASLDQAIETWQAFLLDRQPDSGRFEQHLIPLEVVAETSTGALPPGFNRYLLRAIDYNCIVSQNSAFIFVKFGHFALLGVIVEPNMEQGLNTRIDATSGRIDVADKVRMSGCCWGFMMRRSKEIATKESAISPRQRQRIEADFRRNSNRVPQSETLRAKIADLDWQERQRQEKDEEGEG